MEERPCEDILRRQSSASQEERCHKQPDRHLEMGLLTCRTVRKQIFIVSATQTGFFVVVVVMAA